MQTYRIPQTDLEVSRLAYGTWHLGGSWDDAPLNDDLRERAARLIYTAVEQGINFIDLADIYTRGKSDALIGELIARDPALRRRVILQQKIGIRLTDPSQPDLPGRYDFSYEHLNATFHESLKRLNTDHVELLLLHRPDPLIEPEEVARLFDALHAAGKVRYFGVSNHSPMQIALLKKYVRQPLVVNQLELNLLHHYLINDGVVVNIPNQPYAHSEGLLDYCRLHDIMIQAWSPVAGGRLFNPPHDAPETVKAASAAVARLAAQHQTSQEAIALAWLLRHPAKIQPILGTLNAERLILSCQADTVTLSREEWYYLFSAARGWNVP